MNLRVECFKTMILESSGDLFDIGAMKCLKTFRCEKFRLLKRPLRMVADPFLFVYNNTLYMFYEQFRMNTKGVIAMVSTKDLENWTDPVVVLEEPYHLSFPWVFVHEDKVFMIPESGSDKSVRLYEADNDSLNHFSFVKLLVSCSNLKDSNDSFEYWFGDSTILEKEGLFYLFSSFGKNGANELRLFLSEDITGPYREHPASPICLSSKFGRNAGPILSSGGKDFRVAQDCVEGYGENIHVMEVDEITPTTYQEHVVHENIIPRNRCFFRNGGHQFSTVFFLGKTIVAVDAKEYNLYLWNRVLSKLGFYKD